MPILEKETSIYPYELLDCGDGHQDHCDEQQERRWWVVFAKSRQEKSLARQLAVDEIPFYLPLVSKNHMYRGRRRTAHVPLFPGYVFLYGSENERVRTLSTNRIVQIFNVLDQQELHNDLKQVHQLIEGGAPLTEESQLTPGRRVRIKSGPMQGLEGTITARRGEIRLLIAVHFLQSGVSMEIDDYMVEPIDR